LLVGDSVRLSDHVARERDRYVLLVADRLEPCAQNVTLPRLSAQPASGHRANL
jgi:hypothetical protein